MSHAWLEQRERGSLAAMRLLSWLTARGGYGLGRALLAPICAYFIIFSVDSRRASRDYWRRVTGRRPRWRDVYRQYHAFASTMLDRIDLLAGRLDGFDLRVSGADSVLEALEARRGCLLLGSHLGSFEMMRAVGTFDRGLAVNVVMHADNAARVSAWMRELAPAHSLREIAPGRPDTMLRVRDCLARGEIVAMLADRPIGDTPVVPVQFLGGTVHLPEGPFRLARVLRVPVVLFFGLWRDCRSYDIRFEPLKLGSAAPADETAGALAQCFAARLEQQVRDAPVNWFNFYDYWRAR
jgi:predicted LPLAT superfamily acyltransferase